MGRVKALVLSGDGMNCEFETARAFEKVEVDSKIVHINDLLEEPSVLNKSHILALPGGFSFGDEVGSGSILAQKLKYAIGEELEKFLEKGLVIGICNGFQVLTRLGLLPGPSSKRLASLTENSSGRFINRWVQLKVNSKTCCVWTKGINEISLPIRHGEGRVVFAGKQEDTYHELEDKGQVVFNYTEDINGSFNKVAALCDPSGKILGLMPHPEAATDKNLSPFRGNSVLGLELFKNAKGYIEKEIL